ncbi:dephospho-CoA kinase [Weissella oryzae SG25]|uniref:Dephospho-CoA kinase n=1 Tax=Weissella oryzae (strain DSM 25784 / JCM 18191 / LMG 30913 / SG25) TaxID=1329250 RepID=A0A069CSK1_WEIOS|nr:dephospho-CoA kinase [Weissella oryzae]GAK30367.1 dephospho-CoA kinase [Weissella oryzae SG25]
MIKVGLTGGIASGKSLVASYLAQKGLPIIDADLIAREIIKPGMPALLAIKEVFGHSVFNADGTLNRKALGEFVFSNAQALADLNAITHPYIYSEINRQLLQYQEAGNQLVILDIPLLYESGNLAQAQPVIVVTVSAEIQLERLMQRNNLTRVAAQQRIKAQMPLAEKVAKADFVVDNSGSMDETYRQVDQIIDAIKRNN